MIQLLKTISISDPEGLMGPQYWHTFYENGIEKGRIEFDGEHSEMLTAALRGAGIKVLDLTATQTADDETQTDV